MNKVIVVARDRLLRFVGAIIWVIFIVVMILRLVLALVLSPIFIPLIIFCVNKKNFLGYKVLSDWYKSLCDDKIEIHIEERK